MGRVNHGSLKLFTAVMVVVLFTSICALYILDWDLASCEQHEFTDPAGDVLVGTYYPGATQKGAIVLPGFSADQGAVKNVIGEMHSMGLHVFSFDYSGHGRSPGRLTLDNSQLPRLALQVLSAKSIFKSLSGLSDSAIVIVGHSMGARVAIESQTLDPSPVAGIVAMGASINLGTNVQSEFFTGASDSELEWVQALNASNPPVDLLLITGRWDDVLTPSAAQALIEKLRNGTNTYERQLEIIPMTVHNYEIYSPAAMKLAKAFVSDNLSIDTVNIEPTRTVQRMATWTIAAISFFGMLLFALMHVQASPIPKSPEELERDNLVLINPNKYILAKFLLWFAAMPVGFLISMLFFLLPIGLPIFNLIYVAFIGGYGVLLFLLYSKGRIWGITGKWKLDLRTEFTNIKPRQLGWAIAWIAIITTTSILFGNTGLYFVFPLNARVIWLIIFTAFTFFGWYIGQVELELLERTREKPANGSLLMTLILLFPFLLVVIFFAALGSLSGLIGGIQGLLILALTVVSGFLVQKTGRNKVITALFQAFLLQLLVGPQGALFAL